jgi:hypothetical protein
MSEPVTPPPRLAWWQKPLGMGLLGVILMVGGWMAMGYTTDSAGVLRDLRRQAMEQQHDEGAAGLRERLPVGGEHPFHLPGRFVLLAGIVLFVAAGVRMWQQPAEEEEDRGEPEC